MFLSRSVIGWSNGWCDWSIYKYRAPTVREKPGIRKLGSRPFKVREFHTFYSKSGKSPWILYHLGSIRVIIVAIPSSVLRICFPVLTARSDCFCGPILHCPNLTGSHCELSTLDLLTSVFQNHYGTSVILSRRIPASATPSTTTMRQRIWCL